MALSNPEVNMSSVLTVEYLNQIFQQIPRFPVTVVSIKESLLFTRCVLSASSEIEERHIRKHLNFIAREMKSDVMPIIKTLYKEGVIVMDFPVINRKIQYLDEQLQDSALQEALSASRREFVLPIIIGINENGAKLFDLQTAPHILIAGQTGSGKSSIIKTIIESLLCFYRMSTALLRIVILDSKGIDFVKYDKIGATISYTAQVDEIASGLRVLIKEMERRYQVLAAFASYREDTVSSIVDYNRIQMAEFDGFEIEPYIVVVIDEIADLFRNRPDIEELVLVLVQKARAAGIHLILGTQRPSVDTISGPIRANLPVKICCKVERALDARIVFGTDDFGAHSLIGKGDLLFQSGESEVPERYQGLLPGEKTFKELLELVANNFSGEKIVFSDGVITKKNLMEKFALLPKLHSKRVDCV